MTSGIPPTEQDFELLSTYLDSQLAETLRTQLESRLATEPALREALESLRGTIALLKASPVLTPPRNFILDPVKYRRAAPWWTRSRDFQFVGAFGTLASIIIIALGLLFSGTSYSSYTIQSSNSVDKSAAGPALQNGIVAAIATSSPASALLDQAQSAPAALAAKATVANTSVAIAPTQVVNQAAESDAISGFAAAFTPTAVLPSNAAAPGQQSAGAAGIAPRPQSLAAATLASTPEDTGNAKINGSYQATQIFTATNTMTPTMTATSTMTFSPTSTTAPTATQTETAIAIALGKTTSSSVSPSALPQFLLAIGFALLVLSIMLFGIGVMRSRLKESG